MHHQWKFYNTPKAKGPGDGQLDLSERPLVFTRGKTDGSAVFKGLGIFLAYSHQQKTVIGVVNREVDGTLVKTKDGKVFIKIVRLSDVVLTLKLCSKFPLYNKLTTEEEESGLEAFKATCEPGNANTTQLKTRSPKERTRRKW